MEINCVSIKNEGYVHCKSSFYYTQDILSNFSSYSFSIGINKLIGEIDCGNWAISYLLSMYKHRPEDFILFEQPKVVVNDKTITLNELSKFSCYMDRIYPMFSGGNSVKKLILQGLEQSQINYSYNDVKNLFHIDNHRSERPLAGVGNDIFKSMAAIAFSYGKEIYCFPWLSSNRFNSYHENLSTLLHVLENLNKIVIVPIGLSISNT